MTELYAACLTNVIGNSNEPTNQKDNPTPDWIKDFKTQIVNTDIDKASDTSNSLRLYSTSIDGQKAKYDLTNIHQKLPEKIFFWPTIYIFGNGGNGREEQLIYRSSDTLELNHHIWAGRINQDQTVQEGVAEELKNVLNYTGHFRIAYSELSDRVKDKKGSIIDRYMVEIILLDEFDTNQKIMGCELLFGKNTNEVEAMVRVLIASDNFPPSVGNKLAELKNRKRNSVTLLELLDLSLLAIHEGNKHPDLIGLIGEVMSSYIRMPAIFEDEPELVNIEEGFRDFESALAGAQAVSPDVIESWVKLGDKIQHLRDRELGMPGDTPHKMS